MIVILLAERNFTGSKVTEKIIGTWQASIITFP
jgi:hypothetical protein